MRSEKRRTEKRNSGNSSAAARTVCAGAEATGGDVRLRSYQIGAVPLVNHFLGRLGFEATLREHLPPDDARQELPTERIVALLVRNLLIAREPLYGIPEWAARHAPELFDLYHCDLPLLHDDRLGAGLDRLATASTPEMILALTRNAIRVFGVSLDELHNDSTTIAFHGAYASAAEPRREDGRELPAITWGHSKDRRPDLKQLLFTLTLARDGGVPVYFQVDSGNVNDDTTHRQTWDLLRELVGSPDFLYVADCKLASRENLRHVATRGGRFVTILPASRGEDATFRARLREAPQTVAWTPCWTRGDADEPDDVVRVCSQEACSSDGFRLLWYHSQRKAASDASSRDERSVRATRELEDLRRRLLGPRCRLRERAAVEQAAQQILAERGVAELWRLEVVEDETATYRQTTRGRPTERTAYRRETTRRFDLRWTLDEAAWRRAALDDGVFPLLTNARDLTPQEVLAAYKRRPAIEKRFAQLKSDYDVAPVFLKAPRRVLGLFTAYYCALLLQSLLERELRRALERAASAARALALYPEGRLARRPTARRVLDALEPLRRHELRTAATASSDEPLALYDELSPVQRRLLELYEIDPDTYGR